MGRLNFEGLRKMQNSANEQLNSPRTQQTLVHHNHKRVDEVCEASVKMLDVCGVSKDVLALVKRHLQDLQFTVRRLSIGGDNIPGGIADSISAHDSYRKSLKKQTLKCLHSLKSGKGKSVISEKSLAAVVEALREVRRTILSILESLFSLIAKPWLDLNSEKTSRCSKSSYYFRSKLIKRVSGESSLYDICDEMELQSAERRLQAVETTIECIEVELECIFRRLIETRVSLLNILTK